jgi:hypothetical protein
MQESGSAENQVGFIERYREIELPQAIEIAV